MQDAAGETAATVNEAYAAANEQNAVFMEVRDYLLAANSFGENDGEDAFVGAVFTDKQGDAATIADYTKSARRTRFTSTAVRASRSRSTTGALTRIPVRSWSA